MARAAVLFVVLLCSSALAACKGGSNPAGPSGPGNSSGGTELTVISGETMAPVGAARVVAAGQESTTDGQGKVRFENLKHGDAIDVVAGGFLDRRTTYASNATQITLWPNRPGFDAEYTKQLVYGNNTFSFLIRPMGIDAVSVVISDDLKSPDVVNVFRQAADIVSAANGRIKFHVHDTHDLQMIKVFVYLEPNLGEVPSSTIAGGGNFVLSDGKVGFNNKENAKKLNLAVHELAHFLGIGGHTVQDGVMVDPWMVKTTQFTESELLAMKLVMLRKPGTCYPDNDRDCRD